MIVYESSRPLCKELLIHAKDDWSYTHNCTLDSMDVIFMGFMLCLIVAGIIAILVVAFQPLPRFPRP